VCSETAAPTDCFSQRLRRTTFTLSGTSSCPESWRAQPAPNRGAEYTPLAHVLTQGVTPAAIAAAATQGDHHGWPATWATDGLTRANTSKVYVVSLTTGRTKINAHTGEQSVLATISSPTKTAYTKAHEAAVNDQLVKATIRLADLLNAIAWQ